MKLRLNHIIRLGLLVVFLGGCQKASNTIAPETPTPEPTSQAILEPTNTESPLRQKLLTNMTLTVPETEELISFGGEQGDWSHGYVLIGEPVAQLPEGAVAAIINVNSGGNARDVYLAVFEPGEASLQMTDAKLLGDYSSNAEVTKLITDMETIYVTYMTYDPNMSAQAEAKNQENQAMFTYLNGKLNQIN